MLQKHGQIMMPALVKKHNKQRQSSKKFKQHYSSLGYQSIQSQRMAPPYLQGQQSYQGSGGWNGFSTVSDARAAKFMHYQHQQAMASQYAAHDGNSMTAEQYEHQMRHHATTPPALNNIETAASSRK